MCASNSSNNGYYFYKIIILAMLRINVCNLTIRYTGLSITFMQFIEG